MADGWVVSDRFVCAFDWQADVAALAEARVGTRRETLAALMTKAPASDVTTLGDVVDVLRKEMMVGALAWVMGVGVGGRKWAWVDLTPIHTPMDGWIHVGRRWRSGSKGWRPSATGVCWGG